MLGITRTILYVIEAELEISMVRQSGKLRPGADGNVDAATDAMIDTDMKKDEKAEDKKKGGKKGK